jgi:hypothetical protein
LVAGGERPENVISLDIHGREVLADLVRAKFFLGTTSISLYSPLAQNAKEHSPGVRASANNARH